MLFTTAVLHRPHCTRGAPRYVCAISGSLALILHLLYTGGIPRALSRPRPCPFGARVSLRQYIFPGPSLLLACRVFSPIRIASCALSCRQPARRLERNAQALRLPHMIFDAVSVFIGRSRSGWMMTVPAYVGAASGRAACGSALSSRQACRGVVEYLQVGSVSRRTRIDAGQLYHRCLLACR